jgi:DNA adenine methylase
VEPFAGGAALLFAKDKRQVGNNDHYREVINDTNNLVINFYRVAKLRHDELFNLIDATLYSQSEYSKAKDICKNPDGHDELTLAWAFYVNVHFSFANKLNHGWGTGTITTNQAVKWNNKKADLLAKMKRIEDVHVSCEDAIKCVERWDSPQTLFYCDPPYPNSNQGHYAGYTLDDWQRLCDALDNCKGSYVLSNYAQPIQPQSAQQRLELKARMSAANGKDRTSANTERIEIVWTCDRSAGMRPDIAAIAQKALTPLYAP